MTVEVKQRIESIKINLEGDAAERFVEFLQDIVDLDACGDAGEMVRDSAHYANNLRSSIQYASIHGRSE